jgi:hypothetical protein
MRLPARSTQREHVKVGFRVERVSSISTLLRVGLHELKPCLGDNRELQDNVINDLTT